MLSNSISPFGTQEVRSHGQAGEGRTRPGRGRFQLRPARNENRREGALQPPSRIRERVKKTVEDIIEIGTDLLAVKETLEHGHFGPWLKAEFGWSERTAQNFMSVAERFKSAKIADLSIQPSACLFSGLSLRPG